MNILSIDTTTKTASVAILNNGKITNNSVSNEITHSEKLLPLIDSTLKESYLTLKDIDLYSVINGPGSFTGIRIGLATLKAFSMIDAKKIFSMSSTDLISYKAYVENENNNNEYKYVISLIDARNERVYYSLNKLYKDSNKKIHIEKIIDTSNELIDDALDNIIKSFENIKKESLSNTTNEENINIIISGDCTLKYENKITQKLKDSKLYDTYPTPSDLIDAYFNIATPDIYIYDTYTLDATYARASQAERVQNNEK